MNQQEQAFQTPKRYDWCVNQSYNYSPNYSYSSSESGYNSSIDSSNLTNNGSYIEHSPSSSISTDSSFYQNYNNYYNYQQYYNHNYYNQYDYNPGYFYNYALPQPTYQLNYQSFEAATSPEDKPINYQNESIEYKSATPEKKKSPIKPKTKSAEFDSKILPLLMSTTETSRSRVRTAFSTEQRLYLLSIFKVTSYPSCEVLEEAAKKLNTTKTVIQTWFKNTRSKQKKLTNKSAL